MKMDDKEISACERAEDLVAYLYGEAAEDDAKDFLSHTERCRTCRDELAAFSRLHEDVVEWRNRSLPSFETSSAARLNETQAAPKRSALAALRQFFALSPVWMRAATAAAALVICALVVFTAIRFYRQPERVVSLSPTQAEIQAMVEQRAKELRQKENKETVASAAAKPEKREAPATVKDNPSAPTVRKRNPSRQTQTVAGSNESKNKATASSEARQQLAELVRESRDDDSLPRLSDLIEDSNDSN